MASTDEDRMRKQREAGERESAKLWRACRTVHEMVRDRGYQLSDAEVTMSFDAFKQKYTTDDGSISRKMMNFSASPTLEMIKRYSNPVTAHDLHPSSPDIGTIWVEFLPDSNVGIKQMRAFAQHLTANNFHTGILITGVNITPAALKIIPAVASETRIECFMEADLLVNITHHELVPQHVLLSKEERTALLQRYRLKDTQLPRIQLGDPVARYLGLRRGQVVKIIRKSETAGRYASYRLCV
ncbi:RPB5 subunit of DNA-directed RNA polymerase [Mollisia scopiformis]|uniref:DNA-directed RNA polymerases I, II, and III subunit RPABC1 n=1 Tax=Mollisia scopiformis TaxID=149040 RepID=A0A194XAH5_MOLSC|nr:RPB5 subunit of DNA-directed RNA polymerase [Mollisia scopiformis]KUJ17144.1 RPB5 subunit of DNA-directed RNA polymerase [Mollisia scopiformis]